MALRGVGACRRLTCAPIAKQIKGRGERGREGRVGEVREREEGGAAYLLLLSSAGLIPKMSSSFLPLFFSGFRLRKFSRFLCK